MKSLNLLLIAATAAVLSSCASTAPRSNSETRLVPVNTKLNEPGRATYMRAPVAETPAATTPATDTVLTPVNTKLNDPGRATYLAVPR